MTKAEFDNVLAEHKKWLDSNGKKGHYMNLRGADLRGIDLRDANLHCIDLRNADLRWADLRDAYLRGADLRDADLRDADLSGADLRDANLRGADLRGAYLDFADWPLWCGSLSPKIDARLAAQLMYHAMSAMRSCSDDADVAAVLANADNIRLANRFHRANECGRIKLPEPEKEKEGERQL